MNSFVSTVVALVLGLGLTVVGLPLETGGEVHPLTGSTGCCKN